MERLNVIKADLAELVGRRSPSGKEGLVANYIEKKHKDRGHETDRIQNGVIVVVPGKDRSSVVYVNSHIDTSPDDNWQVDPYTLREIREGVVSGLGVSDDKIGVATMLNLFSGEVPPCDIVCLYSDEEESGGKGTERLMDFQLKREEKAGVQYRRRAGLILEPTYDGDQPVLCNGQKGGAFLKVSAEGEASHGGIDRSNDLVAPPMVRVARFIGDTLDLQRELTEQYGDSSLGTPVLNATQSSLGSTVGNIVPSKYRAIVDMRTNEKVNAAWADEIRPRWEEKYGVKLEFSWWPNCNPSDTASDIFRAAMTVMPHIQVEAYPFASDLQTFSDSGIPTLLYGVGNRRKIHIFEQEELDLRLVTPYVHSLENIIYEFASNEQRK